MKNLVNEWINHAEKDLKAAKLVLNDEDLTNIQAFHSHQCIEKIINALLISKNKKAPRTHNLIKLFGLIKWEYCCCETKHRLE